MNLLRVAVTSLISLAALFLLTKLMGNKQVSQMNLFDYIVGITIGSIAAEMATELDTPENSLLAMVIYAVVAVIISLLTNKSLAARRIMTGKPLILMDGGVIYRDNLKKAKMDLGEFLMYCRIGGYFDLSQIQTALLEHNGKVTFLPVEMQRPATPADFSIQPDQTLLQTPVILDGEVLPGNLQRIGKNVTWLMNQLRQQGYKEAEEVFLAMADGNQLSIFSHGEQEAALGSDGQIIESGGIASAFYNILRVIGNASPYVRRYHSTFPANLPLLQAHWRL